MIVKVPINFPDIECLYCQSVDTEIIEHKLKDRKYIEVAYGCKKCTRIWIDLYDLVYVETWDEEAINERNNNKDRQKNP